MNFPGLEPGWNAFHRALFKSRRIQPWTLHECKAELEKGAKVVVVASTALGDSLLCTPLLKTLSDTLGSERVAFIVCDSFRSLYDGSPWIGKVIAAKGKFRGLQDLKRELNRDYTIALIANATEPDLAPWLWWCGVQGFLRYRTRWSVWHQWFANPEMMRPPTWPDYATGHAVENNLAMAEALGILPTTKRMLVHISKQEIKQNPPLVLIHPGASRVGKCWPIENWATICQRLRAEFSAQFGITGGPGEVELATELAKRLPQPTTNFAGQLSLPELAKLQTSAALFLSGDTGPYHLAVAVGCPTVTLFAPRDRGSSIEACGPYGVDPNKHFALQTSKFNEPISTIAVNDVLANARQALTSAK